MVVVRQLGPTRRVGLGVLAWSVVVGLCLFVHWTAHHAGISSGLGDLAVVVAGVATAALGFWLGWSRRTGTAFVAPLLAWVVLAPFAFASELVQRGILSGLWHGFLLATFGGFVAAFVEGVILVAFAVLGRVSIAALHRGADTTIILPPRAG